ncbi:transporter substrate-binding domain-containing protein [Leptolyngbya cf. ectocarpi LEGE 11479]|uniref:Transporter substrate-binding domain-containing protein n=1 Tax=Leptolyngbya cf. ectocarpi LEGE 11479 TaxID=1828722 RepID=A0A928ZVP0_LEPEC|nr:transporter substrate-binding domain-containing protein [Leptolyngbya ectocarpi]MBE9068309.1 transporter substrate-binding domain-containing protein [Leptolyngbya cf. ectocarpi LEGE 11479]
MIRHLSALTTIVTGLWFTPSALGQTPLPIVLSAQPSPPEQVLRVGTKELPPFVSIQPSTRPYGYSADLWQAIAGDLNIQTEWVTYPSVSDLLTGVQTGEVDVAIAGISITAQREAQGLDFSYPFYQSGLQLMVPKSDSTVTTLASGLLQWRHLRPIFLIFASSTLVGGLIWLVERNHNEHFSGNPIEGVSQGIWFAIVTLGTFGYGDVTPTKFTGRLIATLWMGLSFFIVADFIASLTVHQLSESTVDLQTLSGESVGAIADTTGAIFLQSQPVQLVTYPDFETAVSALETGKIQGLIQDAPALQHFINLNPDAFELAGHLLTHEGYGIAVRERDTELLEAIDQQILEYQQQGFLQQLHRKWFNEPAIEATAG